jgi:hypothetical protein
MNVVVMLVDFSGHMYAGSLVQEVHQFYYDWLSQVVRVYVEENFAHE